MKKILFYYSLLFFFFSLIITLLSLAQIDMEKKIPYIKLNNLGVFISFIPCVSILRNERLEFPERLKVVVLILVLFCLFCLCNSFFNMTPIENDGKYYLVNHGNETKIIDKSKYIATITEDFICDSSRWMLFYGISSIIFFLSLKENKDLKIIISS